LAVGGPDGGPGRCGSKIIDHPIQHAHLALAHPLATPAKHNLSAMSSACTICVDQYHAAKFAAASFFPGTGKSVSTAAVIS